ncbi:acetyl-CoA synthetase-like protein [Calocera viscosa TUFC12733]|uniref:Acetyl-CoA synthetase-like protein n=1 Tax=Calocera viscosa (strain TUFC12733) TaxID=1330018 RepID=A0A167Q401_CALVF|nr:acetyl-CoA synthetase-like protein [Calocera viscosa TUFC12733]
MLLTSDAADIVFPWPKPIDFSMQSFEVPGTRRAGQTGHYRNSAHPELASLDSPLVPFKTIPGILDYALSRNPGTYRFLGHLPILKPATLSSPPVYADEYSWLTYEEGDVKRRHIGAGIEHLYEQGVVGANEEGLQTAGIWSVNRPEWQLIDYALMSYSRVSVSLYDTFGRDACAEYIINHSGLQLAFTTASHIKDLLALGGVCPSLKVVVSIDDLDPVAWGLYQAWGKEKGLRVMLLSELEKLGRESPRPYRYPQPEDVATISYTSGTTGNPKGVVLTHKNLVMAVYSHCIGNFSRKGNNEVMFSYLPLAHIYGRTHEQIAITNGLAIGYSSGDTLRLLEECRLCQPAFFIAVPRVLNRIYNAVNPLFNVGGLKGRMIQHALAVKLRNLHTTGAVTHPVWDRLVFNKVRQLLGGKIEVMASGAAPISGEVLDWFKVVFCCEMMQGYGMTENCAAASHVYSSDPLPGGTVGPPSPGNEIKLVDVPAMKYFSTDRPCPRGEICLRGDNCFKRYYKDEKNTRETVDDEAWVHTGDVGLFDEHGRLVIIDRVKNIMKLSQGEYVALEKVESAYSTIALIAQIFVYGDGTQDYVVAVVVPDPVPFAPFASRILGKEVDEKNPAALEEAARDQRVVDAVLGIMMKTAQREGLKGFEMVKRIHISMEPFTIENGLLTSTLKLKRRDGYAAYKKDIDALYALGAPVPVSSSEKARL